MTPCIMVGPGCVRCVCVHSCRLVDGMTPCYQKVCVWSANSVLRPTGSVCLRTCACCPTRPACRCRPSRRTPCRRTAATRRRTTPTSASPVRPSAAAPAHQTPRGVSLLLLPVRPLTEALTIAFRFFLVRAHDKRIACEEEFSDSEDEGEGGRRNTASFKKAKRTKTEGEKEAEEKEKKGVLLSAFCFFC